ncbi:chromosome partitioning protein [Desulfonispora thiosulfatigenes DSM 11270]|uniref:Chromosome partitioning protein n=1 Tax=Desulfonispora thiosulfatigenes DSM 11270 TaxID=656914 RepID=A0A1W1VQ15_DESTI|nr:ParA family protein [Desulfonispora thiosulfatigenes]SMB95448.1 chromosome partitioning protein [Desulfonispora thiosulfatigenes DSM 11270]
MTTHNNAKNVISFINMKGGVGKTTLCLSLAYQLSMEDKKKILIIDMDPQFNATQTMMEQYDLVDEYLNKFRTEKSIINIFKRKKSLTNTRSSEIELKPEDTIIKSTINENLDIICGNIDIIFEDNNQDSISKKRLDLFIRKHKLNEYYDFIFIDCPPTISFFTDASLIASDYYLIPVKIDKFSILGVKMLDNVIALMKEDPENKVDCLGIVYTMEEKQKKLESIKDLFEENELIRDNYYIFSNTMPKHNHLLSGSKGNIAYNYDDTRGDIRSLSKEFLRVYFKEGEQNEECS